MYLKLVVENWIALLPEDEAKLKVFKITFIFLRLYKFDIKKIWKLPLPLPLESHK